MTNQGSACRRCSDCDGMSHHWLPDMMSQDDEDFKPGDYGCKHCDIRGNCCPQCQGEGCQKCESEGVIPLTDEEYGREMQSLYGNAGSSLVGQGYDIEDFDTDDAWEGLEDRYDE